jgi:hypothetical protein
VTGRKKTQAPIRSLAGPKAEKTVSLGLQGGGAHGAFTWGVLDAILEDGRIAIEGMSGTSAGPEEPGPSSKLSGARSASTDAMAVRSAR